MYLKLGVCLNFQSIPAIGVFFRFFLYFVELPQQQRFRTVAKDCKLDIVSLWHTRSLEWGLHSHIVSRKPHNTKLFWTLFKKPLTPSPFVLNMHVANLFDGLFKKRGNICREIRRKFVETLSNLPYTRNFTLNLRHVYP